MSLLPNEAEELHRLRAQVKALRSENLEYEYQRAEAIEETERFAKEGRDAAERIQAALGLMRRCQEKRIQIFHPLEVIDHYAMALGGVEKILRSTP